MEIRYELNPGPSLKSEHVLALLAEAGISNPFWSVERMDGALRGSALVVCALEGEALVGFARVISDRTWIAYLCQLAVKPGHQKKGIGTELIARVRAELGDGCTLLVHSAVTATGFYETAGFKPHSNIYRIPRTR